MDAEGRAILGEAHVPEHAITYRRTCDMRLVGQAHQIPIDVPDGPLSDQSAAVIGTTFERTYLDRFKRAAPGVAVEALNWRLTVSGPSPSLPIRTGGDAMAGPGATPRRDVDVPTKGRRPIYLPEARGFVDGPVYDRYVLRPGDAFPGPAIVEERESTVIVGPHGSVTVDDWQSLVIRLGQSGA